MIFKSFDPQHYPPPNKAKIQKNQIIFFLSWTLKQSITCLLFNLLNKWVIVVLDELTFILALNWNVFGIRIANKIDKIEIERNIY